jgi:hypothetical protein
VATFSVTPTVSGMNVLYARVTAPLAASIQTTLAHVGAAGLGFFVDAVAVGSAAYWSNFILWNQPKVANPGWEQQLAAFTRPSQYALSSAYTDFVRATFDNTLYNDTNGNQWNSTTGSVLNMVLKPQFIGEQTDIYLIKNVPISSCYVAPVSNITGVPVGLGRFYADNGSYYQQWWDNSYNSGPFIRWGYKFSVTARSVGMCLYILSDWNGATITLRGFTSNAFVSGTTLVTILANNIGTSYTGVNYTWFQIASPGSYTHYEIRANQRHNHYTFAPILSSS